jgi:hypothetical protein
MSMRISLPVFLSWVTVMVPVCVVCAEASPLMGPASYPTLVPYSMD